MIATIEEIQRLTAGLDAESIGRDVVLYKAVLYNFVIIGEAARSMPEDICKQHPEIDWAGIRAMRNVVTHVYFGVNAMRVHQTIRDDLPPTLAALRAIPKSD
jgi:uncharacterized protein with HEPN domain